MDIGKSTRVAMVMGDRDNAWLCEQYGCNAAWASRLRANRNAESETIRRLSRVFGLSPSEFVLLGEGETHKGDNNDATCPGLRPL